MGQNVLIAAIPPALTLQECFLNGRLNIISYVSYRHTSDHYIEEDKNMSTTLRTKKRKLGIEDGIVK